MEFRLTDGVGLTSARPRCDVGYFAGDADVTSGPGSWRGCCDQFDPLDEHDRLGQEEEAAPDEHSGLPREPAVCFRSNPDICSENRGPPLPSLTNVVRNAIDQSRCRTTNKNCVGRQLAVVEGRRGVDICAIGSGKCQLVRRTLAKSETFRIARNRGDLFIR